MRVKTPMGVEQPIPPVSTPFFLVIKKKKKAQGRQKVASNQLKNGQQEAYGLTVIATRGYRARQNPIGIRVVGSWTIFGPIKKLRESVLFLKTLKKRKSNYLSKYVPRAQAPPSMITLKVQIQPYIKISIQEQEKCQSSNSSTLPYTENEVSVGGIQCKGYIIYIV